MRIRPSNRRLALTGLLVGLIANERSAETAWAVTAHGITLTDAIDEALARSPDLAAATETVAQAAAELKSATLISNPELSAGTTLQPFHRFTRDDPGGPQQYGVGVTQSIDALVFGKRSAAIESARRGVGVAEADVADLRRQRKGEVAAAFFDVLEARTLLDLARTNLDGLARVESLTRRRVELESSAPIDVDRARLAVATAAQDVRAAETTHSSALAALRSLLGRGEPEPGFDVAGALDVPTPAEPPDLEVTIAAAAEQRPSLDSLHHQVERADAEVHSQRRQALPTLSVEVGYIYQQQEPIGANDFNLWEATGTMSLPIFDRNQGNIAKAESAARQARQALAAGHIALRGEITQALAAFRAARAGVVADDPAQLAAPRSVRDRVEAAYEAGGRTILEVLDAERAYRDAVRLHVQMQSAYWHALHRLNAAAGMPVLK